MLKYVPLKYKFNYLILEFIKLQLLNNNTYPIEIPTHDQIINFNDVKHISIAQSFLYPKPHRDGPRLAGVEVLASE